MLDAMRSRAGGWVAKIFITLLAASFAVWGVADVFNPRQGDVLVTVGDVEITADEYRNVFNRQVRQISRQIGRSITPEMARDMGLDRQILNQLIRDAAFTAQARNLGLAVPNRAVVSRIAGNSNYQNAQGEFDPQDFRRLLAANGLSEGEFIATQRQEMLSGAISDALGSGIAPPRPLVEALWQFQSERRDAQYFEVDAGDVTVPEPSEGELREFHEENPALFEVPERREIALFHADPVELGSRVEISQEALETAYERRASDFGTPERRAIQMIPFANTEEAAEARQRIAEGAQFLDIADEKGLSEADATLGELSREELPDPAFAEAAFALDEGEVSQPVEGRLSTALLRVTDVIPADRQPLLEVRDDLVRQLQTERGRENVLDFYDEIEDARAGGQTFEEIAADLNFELRTVTVDRSGVTPDGETADLPASDDVLRTAFDLDVGLEADPVSTNDDGFVWVDVRDIAPASVMSFDDARDEARDAWMQRQRSETVLDRARELQKQAESGTPLEELASQVGTTVRSATDIARGSQTEALGRDAVQALFAAPENGYAVALAEDGESAKVMRSSPVLGQPFDSNAEDVTRLAGAVEAGLYEDLTQQYVSALQSNLDVQLNEDLWQRISTGRI
ncbi:MAG TPA: SurA N-terminal domain-containing protein [Aestuariivirgaceae bacterium]|nr:SurA N-terminal domain-containing protein [Aestuariivirgaceae bacterium]